MVVAIEYQEDSQTENHMTKDEENQEEVIKEILAIGIPYLIISFLGSAGPLVNTTFFMDYMTKVNGPEAYESAKLASGILQANISQLVYQYNEQKHKRKSSEQAKLLTYNREDHVVLSLWKKSQLLHAFS